MSEKYSGVINRYREYLPITENTPIITLQEGNTPLIKANNLAQFLGVKNLKIYLKYEGANPTGSFKDRGMTVAISKAKEEDSPAVMCASTGNTAASAAAYAAAANLKCFVVIPEAAIAVGKLSQALLHGAEVIAIDGNFDAALELTKQICEKYHITLVNSINPYRIEGQKTAAFEICDELGDAPTYHIMPVGNAGNITAYWRGYKEYKQLGKIKSLPKMLGFQAAGAAPLVLGKPIKRPKTIATAIRIGNPASWEYAIQARDESGGLIDKVTDREIITAYKLVARLEGLFVEPASAAAIAGLIKLYKNNYFCEHSTIVCILTGHGLKDPDRAIKVAQKPKVIKPEIKSLMKIIKCESQNNTQCRDKGQSYKGT